MITMIVQFGGKQIKTLSYWPITKVMLELIIFSLRGKWNLLCCRQTIRRIILAWLYAEQVGGGSRDTNRFGESGVRQQNQLICTKLYPQVLTCFLCTTYPTTNWVTRISFKIFSKKCKRWKTSSASSRAFPHCAWQCNCSNTAMQKEGCTWDPGNFITPSQAVSVQHPGLCAGCPARRTGNMAQTTLCVIATSHRALWYVHLPWLVLQIALMSLPPCLCSLASSHWSSPGCTTAQPYSPLVQNTFVKGKKKKKKTSA